MLLGENLVAGLAVHVEADRPRLAEEQLGADHASRDDDQGHPEPMDRIAFLAPELAVSDL